MGLCNFPSPGLSPSRSRNTGCPPSTIAAGRAREKADSGNKESSFATSFLLQLNCSCPKAKHILIMMWDLSVTKALAAGCQAPGFVCLFCNFFCAPMNSIQLPFPEERKGSTVVSDQYFILDHRWAPEGTFPVWCGEIQYTALPHVSEMHASRERSTQVCIPCLLFRRH